MHISSILHIKSFLSAKDGDQLVDFYWIDPMLVAESIAAKSKYAGNHYLQFELEDSWERPGTRAFGRRGASFLGSVSLRQKQRPIARCFLH